MNPAFPALPSAGPPVSAKNHVAPGTGKWIFLGGTILALLCLVTIFILLLLLPILYLTELVHRKRIMARLKGSHVMVSARQFPEIYACVKEYSNRLGLKDVPDIYIVESSGINAFAFRIGSRRSVSLIDDTVWGALQASRLPALQYIIAHELAHHALGHTSALRLALSNIIFPLGRLDEMSADAVALQLVGDREIAIDGLTMLTIGPQLMGYVDKGALLQQASEVAADKNTKKGEAGLTHPVLLRRINAIAQAPLARS